MSSSSTRLPTPEGLGSVSDAPNQLLASTLEHVLRTFGAPPTPNRRTPP